MSDTKLSLLVDNDGKCLIRYRKKGDYNWSSYYSDYNEFDDIIDSFLQYMETKKAEKNENI